MQVALALLEAAEPAIEDAIRAASEDDEASEWVRFEAATLGLRRYAELCYDAEGLVAGAQRWRHITTEEADKRAMLPEPQP